MEVTCTGRVDPYGFEDLEGSIPRGTRNSQKEGSESTNPKGEAVKASVILKPEHKKWVEDQDFGLSVWVRSLIDEKIEKETVPEIEPETEESSASAGEEGKPKSEEERNGSSPEDHFCSVCGERKASMKSVKKNGDVLYVCNECMEEASDKPSREEDPKSESGPNPTCEMCEMNEAVEQVPMGPGRDKMWLCETCMQEEGFRQARRH